MSLYLNNNTNNKSINNKYFNHSFSGSYLKKNETRVSIKDKLIEAIRNNDINSLENKEIVLSK